MSRYNSTLMVFVIVFALSAGLYDDFWFDFLYSLKMSTQAGLLMFFCRQK